MASNEEIAFEIYKNIRDKQNKQIELGTIKEEDVIELAESNFIEELHKTILFQTASIEGFKDLNPKLQVEIVNSTYSNIFDSINKVNDVKELVSSDGIRIPNEIIKASINTAIKINENDINQNKINPVDAAISVGAMAKLMQLETIEEKMEYFENLSEEEKEEVIGELIENNFGKEVGDRRKEVKEDLDLFKKSQSRKHMSKEKAEEIEEAMKREDPMFSIAEKLGLKDFDVTDINKGGQLLIIIDDIKRNFGDKKPSFEELLECISNRSRGMLSQDEINAMAEAISSRSEKNINEIFEVIGVESLEDDRRKCEIDFFKYKPIILNILKAAYPELENEIDLNKLIYVVRGAIKDGNIDHERLLSNFEIYFLKSKKIEPELDFESFDTTVDSIKNSISQLKNAIQGMKLPEDISVGPDSLITYGEAIKEDGTVDENVLEKLIEKNESRDAQQEKTIEIPITEFSEFFGTSFENGDVWEHTGIEKPVNKENSQLTDMDVRKGIEQGTLQQEEMIVATDAIRTAPGEQEEGLGVEILVEGQVEPDNKKQTLVGLTAFKGLISNGETKIAESDLEGELSDLDNAAKKFAKEQQGLVNSQPGVIIEEPEENSEDLTQ